MSPNAQLDETCDGAPSTAGSEMDHGCGRRGRLRAEGYERLHLGEMIDRVHMLRMAMITPSTTTLGSSAAASRTAPRSGPCRRSRDLQPHREASRKPSSTDRTDLMIDDLSDPSG